mmetsp:Transcript_42082/g.127657  ORF Transcript_42082/g.127657 Transcript_42082/m.127657 type:complete len:200 (-) Transcript_42082:226-825(-)
MVGIEGDDNVVAHKFDGEQIEACAPVLLESQKSGTHPRRSNDRHEPGQRARRLVRLGIHHRLDAKASLWAPRGSSHGSVAIFVIVPVTRLDRRVEDPPRTARLGTPHGSRAERPHAARDDRMDGHVASDCQAEDAVGYVVVPMTLAAARHDGRSEASRRRRSRRRRPGSRTCASGGDPVRRKTNVPLAAHAPHDPSGRE